MCSAPSPPPMMPMPKPRQMAREPQRQNIRANAMNRVNTNRNTLMNVDGQVRRAPTARLGGQPVVLGG